MNDITTKSENKKMDELFLAIYFNDLEKVIEFKNQYPEIYAKKNIFQIESNVTFDLTNLTLFNQTIWFDNEWRKEIMPLIEKLRQRTERMLDFWRAELGEQISHRKIEYNRYNDFFYCQNIEDTDEVILDPISFFLEKGFHEIDLKLYNRVACFDFKEVRNLLEQGAKFNIDFYEDGDSDALSGISIECSYLATSQVIPEFEVFEEKGYNQDFDIKSMFGDLLGMAANQEMYYLLVEYKDKV